MVILGCTGARGRPGEDEKSEVLEKGHSALFMAACNSDRTCQRYGQRSSAQPLSRGVANVRV